MNKSRTAFSLRPAIALVVLLLFLAPTPALCIPKPLDLGRFDLDANGKLTGKVTNITDQTLTNVMVIVTAGKVGTGEKVWVRKKKVGEMAPGSSKTVSVEPGPLDASLFVVVTGSCDADYSLMDDMISTACSPKATKTDKGLTFKGAGICLTDSLALEPGEVRFFYEHKGQGDFSLTLLDENAQEVETVFNHKGSGGNYRDITIPAKGSYTLQVRGTGQWIVTVGVDAGTSPGGVRAKGGGNPVTVHKDKDGTLIFGGQ